MKHGRVTYLSALALMANFAAGSAAAQVAGETVQSMLAAQIRAQGFTCNKALAARKDARLSRPDHEVWVLRCGNANYRVSRSPDMAAKVQPLR